MEQPQTTEDEISPPSARKIGPAIRKLRERAGLSQDALAAKISTPPNNISRWEGGNRQLGAEDLWIIEVVGLDVPAGTIYRMVGFVDDAESGGTLDSIRNDPNLSPAARDMLVAAYEAASAD